MFTPMRVVESLAAVYTSHQKYFGENVEIRAGETSEEYETDRQYRVDQHVALLCISFQAIFLGWVE